MPYLSTHAKFDYRFYPGTMLAKTGHTGVAKYSIDHRLIKCTDILINVSALCYFSNGTTSSVEGENNVCFHFFQMSFFW